MTGQREKNGRLRIPLDQSVPEVAATWHPTRNGDLTPADVTPGSAIRVWWLCAKGHEWDAQILARTRGNGCPICAGRKTTPISITHPELAAQWHPRNGELTPDKVTAGSGRKLWWLCENDHVWVAQVNNRTHGSGCPICANRNLGVLVDTNPKLAAEWHPSKNGTLTPDQVTAGSSKKVWWLCEHGHEWSAPVAYRNRGTGCPVCSIRRRSGPLGATHPQLAAEWHPSKNEPLMPEDITAGSGKKVWWLCSKGHEWQSIIRNRARGVGCPYCAGRRKEPISISHPHLAVEWHPTKNGAFSPGQVTAGSGRKVWWLCPEGHEWTAQIKARCSGNGCPSCAGRKADSLAETNPHLAAQWHPTKNGPFSPSHVTEGSTRKVWWRCEDGHEWAARIYSRRRTGCPICARAR